VNHFQDNWAELLPLMDYAQATLPHDSTGYALIQLEIGYLPRTSFDWNLTDDLRTAREILSRDEARKYAERLQDAWELACKNLEKSQLTMAKQANRHRREPDFDVGDKVWVTTKN
jgi:hypothetical protein